MAPSMERRGGGGGGGDVASMPLRAAADINSLRETADMLDELRNVYGGSDESARMTSVKARREQLKLEARRREESCKEIILSLQSSVEDARQLAQRKVSKEEAEAEYNAAAEKLASAKENVARMESQSRALEQKHEAYQNEVAELSKKREELETLATEEYPKTNHARSLYAHISRITWADEGKKRADGSGTGKPGTVEGTYTDPEGGDIRKFSFNVADDGGVFGVTNKLWELMDA